LGLVFLFPLVIPSFILAVPSSGLVDAGASLLEILLMHLFSNTIKPSRRHLDQ